MSHFALSNRRCFNVLAKFGSIEGIEFDHYVTDWDFDSLFFKDNVFVLPLPHLIYILVNE